MSVRDRAVKCQQDLTAARQQIQELELALADPKDVGDTRGLSAFRAELQTKDGQVTSLLTDSKLKDDRAQELSVALEAKEKLVTDLNVASDLSSGRIEELRAGLEKQEKRSAELNADFEMKDRRITGLLSELESISARNKELGTALRTQKAEAGKELFNVASERRAERREGRAVDLEKELAVERDDHKHTASKLEDQKTRADELDLLLKSQSTQQNADKHILENLRAELKHKRDQTLETDGLLEAQRGESCRIMANLREQLQEYDLTVSSLRTEWKEQAAQAKSSGNLVKTMRTEHEYEVNHTQSQLEGMTDRVAELEQDPETIKRNAQKTTKRMS